MICLDFSQQRSTVAVLEGPWKQLDCHRPLALAGLLA